jgi:hypothetical protein
MPHVPTEKQLIGGSKNKIKFLKSIVLKVIKGKIY